MFTHSAIHILFFILYRTTAYTLPIFQNNVPRAENISKGPAVPLANPTTQTVLLWTSIGLAIITSICQGFIVIIVTIAEDQGMWTFRFRIARYEHRWWTVVSTLLSISFVLIVLSFLSGNNNNSLDVLAISTAMTIAIVNYTIPAWRNRDYVEVRWLAWTGPSRTAISSIDAKFCGSSATWLRIRELHEKAMIIGTPTDSWGWTIIPPKGIAPDPTDLLYGLKEESLNVAINPADEHLGCCLYDDGFGEGQVSLLWGEREGFRRRVSRAVTSVPITLLASGVQSAYNGFNGKGLCLAMGILGRNKGLNPKQLVFDMNDKLKKSRGVERIDSSKTIASELESTSAWSPRPNKVLRSVYGTVMRDQYSGLEEPYINASVELALILLDCPAGVVRRFLNQKLEQQSLGVNKHLSSLSATPEELKTLYRSSYTSMIIAINYFDQDSVVGDEDEPDENQGENSNPRRPDLTCFALLWAAEGGVEPNWWRDGWVKIRLEDERNSLRGNWRRAASWLLGLRGVPPLLDKWPNWDILV